MSPYQPPRTDELPLGIGKLSVRSVAAALLCTLGIAFGIVSYLQQVQHGCIATGLRTIGNGGATWGLYIAFLIFFMGVAFAGITVSLLVRLFDLKPLRPVTRMAQLLTIVALLMGALCVLADLGRPLRGLMNLPRYARSMSPFFGTFSLVICGYLFASLVYFYLAGRADAAYCAALRTPLRWIYRIWASGFRGTAEERSRHHRVSFWLSLAILPLLVIATSTLGFIFGIQSGRPGWFSALQAPGFVVLAGVSGTGCLIALVSAARRIFGLQEVIRVEAIRWLGSFLLVLTAVYLYFTAIEELTAQYAALETETAVVHAVVMGAYALPFWIVIACFVVAFVILFLQYVRRRTSIAATVIAGVLVNVAAVLKRVLIVIPSQTHGMLLPYPTGSYFPTWVEFGVVTGLFSLGALLYLAFVKCFPIVPIDEGLVVDSSPHVAESGRSRVWRVVLTLVTLATGITLAVTGFLYSARFGVPSSADPALPLSPVIFIAGVMAMFYSAAVFETLPPVAAIARSDHDSAAGVSQERNS